MDSIGTYDLYKSYHNSPTIGFQAVKWKSDDTEIFCFTGGDGQGEFRLYIITVSTGDQKTSFQFKSGNPEYSLKHRGIVSIGDNVYLAIQSTAGKAIIVGFDTTQTSDQNLNLYQSSTSSGSQWDSLFVSLASSSFLISVGTITYSSKTYWGVNAFAISAPTISVFSNAIQGSFSGHISQYFDSGSASVFSLCSQDTTSPSQLYFWYYSVDYVGNGVENTLVSKDFNDGTSSCKGLYSTAGFIAAHVYTSANSLFYLVLMKLDASGATYKQKLLTNLSKRGNTLVYGVYSGTTSQSYYILNLVKTSSVSGTDNTLTQTSGAIMVEDISGSSCLIESETYDADETLYNVQGSFTQTTIPDPFDATSSSQISVYGNSLPYRDLASLTLVMTTWCNPLVTIVPATNTDSYTILSGSYSMTFTDFSTNEGCTDATFTYQVVDQSSSTLQSLFSHTTGTSKTVTALSTTESDAGTKVLDIIGTLDQNSQTSNGTLTVTVINPCVTGSITQVNSIGSITYYLGDSTLYYMPSYFSSSDISYYSTCSKKYALYTDAALTSALASNTYFNINTASGSFRIYNTDQTQHGTTQTVYIKQYMNADSTIYQSQALTITLNKCKLTTTTYPTYNTVYYDKGTTAVTSTFAQWTSSLSADCGAFVYTVTYHDTITSNYTTVPSTTNAITFNSATRTFKVYTTKTAHIGSYQIKIYGQTGTEPVSNTFYQTFNIINMCVITATTTDDQSYTVNAIPILSFQFTAFTTTYCVPTPVSLTYTIKVDGSTIPSWMTFSSGTRTITAAPTNNTLKDTYSITITASFYSSWTLKTYTASTSFNMKIIPENTNPPSLSAAPTSQELTAGSQLKYSLGKIDDVDLDGYSVKVTLGKASGFVTFSSPSFTIAPKAADVGTYTITVTLTDDNPAPLSVSYTFDITVNAAATSSSSDNSTSNSTSNSTFQGVIISYDLPANASQADKDKKKVNDALYLNFGAKVKSITNTGVLTVEFYDDILIPQVPYSQLFNNSVMKISITPSEYSNSNDLNFTWNCTSISSTKMIIQLSFKKPRKISIQDTKDSISIKFLQNGYFLQASTRRAIKYSTTITKSLPKQMDPGDAAMLNAVGGSASSSLQGVMMSNLALNIIMSASLQYLWGMINVLQIIVHMPLFSVDFPSNAKALYSLIVSITKFDILPSGQMQSQVFEFEDDGPFNESFQELDIFQTFQNYFLIIQWLQLHIYVMIVSIGIIYDFLSKRIFFNIILRFMLEGYLSFTISALINMTDIDIWNKLGSNQWEPFIEDELNHIEIFNECCILYCSYHLMLFTSYVNDVDMQYNFGFSLIAVTILNVVTNTSLMMIKTFAKVKLGIKKLRHKLRINKYNKQLKRAENYYLKEQDLEAHEGAFINKVYRNLQQYQGKSIDEEGVKGQVVMGMSFVSPIRHDFFYDPNLDISSMEGSSPTKMLSLNNTTTNFLGKQDFEHSSLKDDDSTGKFTPMKSQDKKSGVMKSIFSYFQNRTAKEPLEFENKYNKHSSMLDRSSNINVLQQSLDFENMEEDPNQDFDSSQPIPQSTKNMISANNNIQPQENSKIKQLAEQYQNQNRDFQLQDTINGMDVSNTNNTLMGMNFNEPDINDQDEDVLNAPPLQEQNPKNNKAFFQNVLQQLQNGNEISQSDNEENAFDDQNEEDYQDDFQNTQDLLNNDGNNIQNVDQNDQSNNLNNSESIQFL
eukprot:403373316